MHPNTRLCAYTKVDGNRCGGAAHTDSEFCRHHHNLATSLDSRCFTLPALDDVNSIQVAAMQIMNALIMGKVSRADAYALFYGLYLAKSNLKGFTLCPPAPDELSALLAKTRKEAYEEGYEQGKTEFDRQRAKKSHEDFESLASYLLRELKEPKLDAAGQVMRDPDGNTLYYTQEESAARNR